MATTRLIAMHVNKGKTLAQCLSDRINYAQNGLKTKEGEFISSYQCDTKTVDADFLLSKRQYQHRTGRTQKNDVIAYQLRQAFKPGEITPEEANRIGYETATRLLKGEYAFIVATHIDRAHIHNHIIFNSTAIDGSKKFRNFKNSAIAIQKISDIICLEHGLSVVEPKPYGERTKRTVYPKTQSEREQLRLLIDSILEKEPATFGEFLKEIRANQYEVKDGKFLAFRKEGMERFIRLRSLGEGYSEDDIRAAILGKNAYTRVGRKSIDVTPNQFKLLVDIEQKIAMGKTGGYIHWAKKFNRKEAAKTLCLLKEKGIQDYEELKEKTEQLTNRYNDLSDSIKQMEERITEISELQTHINNYAKTKKIYVQYRESGYSKEFFEENREAILLHRAAKDAFNALPTNKVPSRKELNAEFWSLVHQKKQMYVEYQQVRSDRKQFLIAKQNVDEMLGMEEKEENSQNRDDRNRG